MTEWDIKPKATIFIFAVIITSGLRGVYEQWDYLNRPKANVSQSNPSCLSMMKTYGFRELAPSHILNMKLSSDFANQLNRQKC